MHLTTLENYENASRVTRQFSEVSANPKVCSASWLRSPWLRLGLSHVLLEYWCLVRHWVLQEPKYGLRSKP